MFIKDKFELISSIRVEIEDSRVNKLYNSNFLFSIGFIFLSLLRGGGVNNNSCCYVFFKNEMDSARKNNLNFELINLKKIGFLKCIGIFRLFRNFLIHFIYSVLNINNMGFKGFHQSFLALCLYDYFVKKLTCDTLSILNISHPTSRSIALAAKKLGLKVKYYEHAITPYPLIRMLDVVDECFVSTKFTYDLIRKSFPEMICHYTDSNFVVKHVKNIFNNKISYCVNDNDDFDYVIEIGKLLVSKYGCTVDFRVHDADKRFNRFKSVSSNLINVSVSSAKEVNIKDYLLDFDILIAGNSNVLYDAISQNTPCIYSWNKPEMYDYYGVVSYYSIPSFEEVFQQ